VEEYVGNRCFWLLDKGIMKELERTSEKMKEWGEEEGGWSCDWGGRCQIKQNGV
jgi:hypothetical protein